MGLFGNKQYDMPSGQPATWGKDDVKHWIKHIGMGKHKATFRLLNGQQLLGLTESDINAMCKQDLDARYIFRMLLRLKGEPEQAKVPPAVAAKERAVQYLFQWAGEDAVMSDFREFLDGAGTVTVGLMTAAERMPNNTLGGIVGMVFKIYKSSRDAQVNIYNCRILRYLCVDILRSFHSAGTDTLLSVPTTLFEDVHEQLHKALMLVRSCSKPGWLVRMAYAGKIDAEFSSIHTAAVEMLQEHELDDLYGHAKLPQSGDYTDCCMALQESLHGIDEDVKAALTTFAETGEGYERIKTALSCDDEGLKSEMGYIPAALAVIEKMLPKLHQHNPPPAATPPVALTVEATPQTDSEQPELASSAPTTPVTQPTSPQAAAKHFASPPPIYPSSASPLGPSSPSPMQTQPAVDAEEGESAGASEEAKPLNMYELFLAFCNFGTRAETSEMDGAHFVKFCRDSKLLGKGLTATEVDLVFARVKPKGQRRIVYEEFVEALTLLAEKKSMPLKELTDGVLARGGPIVKATTRTAYTRLHDDRSTYTGVYARGGPTNVDERISLDKMVMRSDPREVVTPRMFGVSSTPRGTTPRTVVTPRGSGSATARPTSGKPLWTPRGGSNQGTFDRPACVTPTRTPRGLPTGGGAGSKNGSPASAPRISRNFASNPTTPRDSSLRKSTTVGGLAVPWKDPAARAELLRVYTAFTEFGHSHAKLANIEGGATMENKQFVKLVKDAGLLGGALSVTRLDIIFSKVRVKGQRKIDFAGFERGLTLLADERGYTLHQVYNAIVSTAGPQLNHVTTPDFVKYHDDRSTYTGVYARGGPTNVDKQVTLEKVVGRNDDIYINSRTPRFVA